MVLFSQIKAQTQNALINFCLFFFVQQKKFSFRNVYVLLPPHKHPPEHACYAIFGDSIQSLSENLNTDLMLTRVHVDDYFTCWKKEINFCKYQTNNINLVKALITWKIKNNKFL